MLPDAAWRKNHFDVEEGENLSIETGYHERPVSWFEANIVPDLLKLKEELNLGDNILEVGCAYGYYSKVLAKHFSVVTAIDFAPSRIEAAKQYNQVDTFINYLLVDIVNEKIPTAGPFSCAISSAVYQHIDVTNGDRKKAFEHTFEVLNSGSYLILYDEKFEIRPSIWDGFYEPMKASWIQKQLGDICELVSVEEIPTKGLHNETEFRWILRKK